MNLFQLETSSVLILWYFFVMYFCITIILHLIFAFAAKIYQQRNAKLMTNSLKKQEAKSYVKK